MPGTLVSLPGEEWAFRCQQTQDTWVNGSKTRLPLCVGLGFKRASFSKGKELPELSRQDTALGLSSPGSCAVCYPLDYTASGCCTLGQALERTRTGDNIWQNESGLPCSLGPTPMQTHTSTHRRTGFLLLLRPGLCLSVSWWPRVCEDHSRGGKIIATV